MLDKLTIETNEEVFCYRPPTWWQRRNMKTIYWDYFVNSRNITRNKTSCYTKSQLFPLSAWCIITASSDFFLPCRDQLKSFKESAHDWTSESQLNIAERLQSHTHWLRTFRKEMGLGTSQTNREGLGDSGLMYPCWWWCEAKIRLEIDLVSHSCAVGESENLRRTTGQSNLVDRMEDCSISQSAVMWVWKPNFGSFSCGQPLYMPKFDCPVARQNVSLLATAHDYETGLFTKSKLFLSYISVWILFVILLQSLTTSVETVVFVFSLSRGQDTFRMGFFQDQSALQ